MMKRAALTTQKQIFFVLVIFFYLLTSKAYAIYQNNHQTKVIAPSHVILGDPFLIKILNLDKKTGFTIEWLGKKIDFLENSSNNVQLILGSDVRRNLPGLKILSIYGKNFYIEKKIILKKRKLSITKIQVAKKYMNLSKLTLKRYLKEKKLLKKILSTFTPQKLYEPHFIPPINPFKITSPYGRCRIINGIKKSIHTGIDIKARPNTKVRAINSGKVLYCGDFLFSGKSIFIDHGQGIISMYFHLNKIIVKQGQMIKKGQIIGLSGSTGRVSGPHLHLGISIFGKMVDPEKLINNIVFQQF